MTIRLRRPRGASSQPRSEGLDDALDAARANGHDLERDVQVGEVRVSREPRSRRLPETPLLLRTDHLEGVAQIGTGLLLYLDEREPATAAHDEIELVAARPGVHRQDAKAPQPVVPEGAPLGAMPRPPPRHGLRRRPRASSRAPRTSGDGCRTAPAGARSPSGPA